MQCSKCGYHMTGSETACACCGRQNLSASTLPFPVSVKQQACGTCGLVQEADSRYCRSCGSSSPFAANRDIRHWPEGLKLFLGVLLLAGLIFGIGTWVVSAQQAQARADVLARQQAEAARVAREARLAATLTSLRAASPAASFERYPGDNSSVTFTSHLARCDVRGLTFSLPDNSSTLSVNVSISGYQAEQQAPKVFVALYGENGDLLAQKAIVEFVNAELSQGETRQVTDTMDYPGTGTPIFVGVSEEAAGTSSPNPSVQPLTSPNPSVGDSNGSDYRAAMSILCKRFDDQGYVTIWPHEGNVDVLGVVVGDAIPGGWSAANKRALTRAMAEQFVKVRRRTNRVGQFKTIVRFTPSGTVVQAISRASE